MQYVLLVRKCLRAYGLLCLGVYRLVDDVVDENETRVQRTLTQKRYVITHPTTDFRLIDTDKVGLPPYYIYYYYYTTTTTIATTNKCKKTSVL